MVNKAWNILSLNTVPTPGDSGPVPFVVPFSAMATEAAKLVKATYNRLKIKHPLILFKPCVTAYKRGRNIKDILLSSRLGKADIQLHDETQSQQRDLTILIEALHQIRD